MQCARDRRGTERQHIDRQTKLQQLVFVFDAETLLFIDDDEPEVSELHVIGEQSVRADDDVDFALRELGENFLGVPSGFEAGDRFDAEGVVAHAFAEGAFVLFSEDGGGDEDRDLLAEFDGFEGSADGDFGFAKAHVAADEAVHGLFVSHVFLDGSDRSELVRRFLERELRFELFLPGRVERVAHAWHRCAGSLDAQQVSSHVFDGFSDLLFLLLPALSAEHRERGFALETADVFLHEIDLRRGYVQQGFLCELEGEELLAGAGAFAGLGVVGFVLD